MQSQKYLKTELYLRNALLILIFLIDFLSLLDFFSRCINLLDLKLVFILTPVILVSSAAANGDGSATIRTSASFDREKQKEYLLPVVIWDMNNGQNSPLSLTGTSTLTIEIGDKNDNKHSPGHQEITFNNFDGKI